MLRKGSIFFLCVCNFFIIFILISCGTKKEGGVSKERVTIVYSNWEHLPEQIKANQALVSAFEVKHPGIRVVYQSPAREDKILIQIAGGDAPDVFFWLSQRFPQMVKQRVIQDLTSLIANDTEFRMEDYFSMAIDSCRYQGGIYGIPTHIDAVALYFNKDLFDREKLTYPDETWTWDKYVEVGKILTKDINGDGRIDQFGVYRNEEMWVQLAQNKIEFFDVTGTKSGFDNPDAVKVVQFDIDLRTRHRISTDASEGKDSLGGAGLIGAFSSGRVGMFIGGAYIMPELLKIKGLRWEVAPVPTPEGKQLPLKFNVAMNVMSSSTKYPKEVWEFMKFYSGPEGRKIFSVIKNSVPAFKEAVGYDTFQTPPPEHVDVFVKAVEGATVSSFHPKFEEVRSKIFGLELSKARLGMQSAEETVKKIARLTDEILQGKQ